MKYRNLFFCILLRPAWDQGTLSGPRHFCAKFSHQMALVTCPNAIRLRRHAQSAGLGLGLWHFHSKFSREWALLRCPCAFRRRRLAQSVGPGLGLRHFHSKFSCERALLRCRAFWLLLVMLSKSYNAGRTLSHRRDLEKVAPNEESQQYGTKVRGQHWGFGHDRLRLLKNTGWTAVFRSFMNHVRRTPMVIVDVFPYLPKQSMKLPGVWLGSWKASIETPFWEDWTKTVAKKKQYS